MAAGPPLSPEPGQLCPDHRGASRAGPPAGHARAARDHPGRRGPALLRPLTGPGDGHDPAAASAAERQLFVARPGDGPAPPDLCAGEITTALAVRQGSSMDLNRLTQKSQEALHDAQTKALRYGHQEVDGEHLLLPLLEQSDGLVPPLLARAGADVDRLREDLGAELEKRPRVTGSGAEAGKVYVTQRLNRVLEAAE